MRPEGPGARSTLYKLSSWKRPSQALPGESRGSVVGPLAPGYGGRVLTFAPRTPLKRGMSTCCQSPQRCSQPSSITGRPTLALMTSWEFLTNTGRVPDSEAALLCVRERPAAGLDVLPSDTSAGSQSTSLGRPGRASGWGAAMPPSHGTEGALQPPAWPGPVPRAARPASAGRRGRLTGQNEPE